MFTIAPIYVVAAIAAAVESTPGGASPGTARGARSGCEVVESFEREIHARSGFTLTDAEAGRLLAEAALLRASLCSGRIEEPAAQAA